MRTHKPRKMLIYNIFPLLAGKFKEWDRHFERAAEMGFNWIYLNPIQLPGKSGSLYSIKDYFRFNPILLDMSDGIEAEQQVRDMLKVAERHGLKVMIDLVINHCAADSDLLTEHPEWFSWKRGRVEHPFCFHKSKKVVWRDLARFDFNGTGDPDGLYAFLKETVDFLVGLGFRGFRCDAAYQIPGTVWTKLIKETKQENPEILFFAETLGCTADKTRQTALAGFEYIFNSSKWWDFKGHWLMEQYNLTRDITHSVSFPDNHDTTRLIYDLKGNIDGLKQRYLFASLFSGGIMMLMGYEFGLRKRTHVVNTTPDDWSRKKCDLTEYITKVNRIKSEYTIFQEDAPTEILQSTNPKVLVIWKASTQTGEEALLILNRDIRNRQHFEAPSLSDFVLAGAPLTDVSPEYPVEFIPEPFQYTLNPGQGLVYVTKRD